MVVLSWQIENFNAIDSAYRASRRPELNVNTELLSIAQSICEVLTFIQKNHNLPECAR